MLIKEGAKHWLSTYVLGKYLCVCGDAYRHKSDLKKHFRIESSMDPVRKLEKRKDELISKIRDLQALLSKTQDDLKNWEGAIKIYEEEKSKLGK